MQTNIVRAIDLIQSYPENYTTFNKVCEKCGGKIYDYNMVYGWECENVVYNNGFIWDESPCNNALLGGG
jgi:hypothetical protein